MGGSSSTPTQPPPTPQPTPRPTVYVGNPTMAPVTSTAEPTTTSAPTCPINKESGTPQLKVTVANLANAGTGDDVYAKVLSGKKANKATWSDWELLNHDDCNNLDVSTSAYFDEFSDKKQTWYAVAVYNCGDDDVVVDSVGVWNGKKLIDIDYFCPTVAGPSRDCGLNDTAGAVGSCYKGSEEYPFDLFTLDQDACQAFAFETTSSSTTGTNVATAYIEEDPGVPACTYLRASRSRAHHAHRVFARSGGLVTDGETQIGLMDVDTAMMAVPFVLLMAGAAAAYRCLGSNRNKNKDPAYQPILPYGTQ